MSTLKRDDLFERFQEACSSITPAIRKEDSLFAEFTERFLWLFYYSGYRHVTWMIKARPDLDGLHSLFRYHWDKDINEPPSGEVLMRAMQLTFHDRLDLPRETVTDHLKECFRDALEELRTSQHKQGEEESASVSQQKSSRGRRADEEIRKRREIVKKHIHAYKSWFNPSIQGNLLDELDDEEVPFPKDSDTFPESIQIWSEFLDHPDDWKRVVDNVLNRDRWR